MPQWGVVRKATFQTNAFGTLKDDFSITAFLAQWAVVVAATFQTNAFGTLKDDFSITASLAQWEIGRAHV